MKFAIGTIVLNEADFVAKNLQQHYEWAGADVQQIIVVEGAVKLFPKDRRDKDGHSLDDTAKIVKAAVDPKSKIVFVQKDGLWEDKSEQRNAYASRVKDDTDYLIVIDADEFYPKSQQKRIAKELEQHKEVHSLLVPQVHLWHGSDKQVSGGYWAVPHLRVYKWKPGSHYAENHNELIWPDGHNLHVRDRGLKGSSAFLVHYGFARNPREVRAKEDYYLARGEATTRPMYVDCREAWFTWTPRAQLPSGAKVWSYKGELPEVMVG